MATKSKKSTPKKPATKTKRLIGWLKSRNIWQKIGLIIIAIVVLFTGVCYGVAQWYIAKHKSEPLRIGATFVPNYARHFGLDPEQTMRAMTDDLGIKQMRLVSYWNMGEPTRGEYDFGDLDWQFKVAEEKGITVSLAIGLRQPRWPECHMPGWAEKLPMTEWEPKLKDYMKATMERYKNSPALESYQLENEFFLDVFGDCPDHTRERLIREYEFAKAVDSEHPIIITRSNNALGLPIGDPRPDEFGVSVYKRVWDKTITKRYFEYPLPPWFYASLAGGGEILTGKNLILHELQTEAWLPDNGNFKMNDPASIPEMNKSLDSERLKDRIQYGVDTGMRDIYLWGPEWWLWRKDKANDPSLWETAKYEIARHNYEQN